MWIVMAISFVTVRPIFVERCYSCHNTPGRDWTRFQDAYARATEIRYRVQSHGMPPGNVTGMTQEERQRVIDWVNQGAKR